MAAPAFAWADPALEEPGGPIAAAPAASFPGPPAGLVIRRVPNPRYRPPLAPPTRLGFVAGGRRRALDHLHLQLSRRGSGTARPTTDWDAILGEEGPDGQRYLVTATGGGTSGSGIRTACFEVGRPSFQVAFGDAPPVHLLPGRPALYGLRGATWSTVSPKGPAWSAALAGPTPLGHASTGSLRIAALGVRDLRYDIARFSAAMTAFRVGPVEPGPLHVPAVADTSPSKGAETGLAWRVPIPRGSLTGSMAAQYHTLDGPGRLAVEHALGWTLVTPRLIADVRDQRSSRRSRRIAGNRVSRDALGDTRWSLQSRHLGGRAEWHFAGAARAGGDSLLESRTIQVGGSASLGRSPWQAGGDAAWERRGASPQRRLTMSIGRFGAARVSFLGRFEHVAGVEAPARHLLTGDVLVALRHGVRATLQPRLGWSGPAFDHGAMAVQLRWPLGPSGGNLAATLAAGADRSQGFRGRLREVGLSFVWAPRLRDRSAVEVRRLDEAGRPQMDFSASYDLHVERFAVATLRGVSDTGTVLVRVVHAASGAGIADALVSLDGTELRFTDAEGIARFDRVPPGVHGVAVDEASLPAHHRISGSARVFVLVERGSPPPAALFEVVRPEKRSTF